MRVSEERLRLLRATSAAMHAETVSCIKNALLALMEQKPYKSIRMTDIIYLPLWNGMIFNAFIEWARAGMPGTVEGAIANVNAGLKQVAVSIETGLRSKAQDKKA